MRALVTGGAGFLGSHLCRLLLSKGWEVVCFDSLVTGSAGNIAGLMPSPAFRFERYDVTNYLFVDGPLDWVMHFASPASPVSYLEHPIKTLKVGAMGTHRALGLAKAKGAGFFLASTSEVYGDPKVHPQPESYWGNVSSVGPRGVYDEAKRYAEALTMAYHRAEGVPVRIARIFNTYGERMQRDDGRAVPTFIAQALAGRPLTVHGSGRQTRSLCYVDDMMDGFWRILCSDVNEPVNLGNPEEVSVAELAEIIRALAGGSSGISFVERPVDDPEVRCPDIRLARTRLGWQPRVALADGLARTMAWAGDAWKLPLPSGLPDMTPHADRTPAALA